MEALRIKANTVPCTALFFLASAYGLFALCMGIVRSGNGTLVVFPRRVQRDLFPRPPGGPRAVFRGGHSIRRPDCGIPSLQRPRPPGRPRRQPALAVPAAGRQGGRQLSENAVLPGGHGAGCPVSAVCRRSPERAVLSQKRAPSLYGRGPLFQPRSSVTVYSRAFSSPGARVTQWGLSSNLPLSLSKAAQPCHGSMQM